MLEPRKADIPALFFVLVVLPVVLYILLGKWSEAAKRKERVNLIVEETFEGSLRTEPMVTSAVPLVVPPPPVLSLRECARCGCPATTRCSRCKSVRYCSGKCQIIHWRQGHKEDCRPQDLAHSSSRRASMEDGGYRSDVYHKGDYADFEGYSSQMLGHGREEADVKSNIMNPSVAFAEFSPASAVLNASGILKPERKVSERRGLYKSTKEMLERNRVTSVSTDANLRSAPNSSKGANTRHKLRGNGSINFEEGNSEMHGVNGSVISGGYSDRSNAPQMHSSNGAVESSNGSNLEFAQISKSEKSMSRAAREHVHPVEPRKGHGSDEPAAEMGTFTSARETNGATNIKLAKTMGVNKLSKISRHDESSAENYKKVKVLFPFEEFIRFFELEVFDLAPRGLLNCGNSCYANAVLQCLTCTKPLVTYLLSRMHSRACCLKNWCLMCELEQHVMMLKEAGGPLSPSRILSHLRGINCQIGDGSQEDAHEFLRLLVASMQSICLEEVGGENKVHLILQETTFVQQTFGGRLRSMVVCLKCHHESERYENIMDLTLEIFGWVESLEDALTQFTTPEDLDGENMYRCTRCASYVRARKQLSIDEAPNILTIVLKRFQEGNYGKINKCIAFPEMLDMVPFMTGTNDIPPLYMLYGVVVHVDTLNASFSGHYVSYVKDLKGNWYRIDDSVVQPVPMSQVMSEGAYILFYRRSSPRPPRSYIRKATRNQVAKSSRTSVAKTRNSSETEQNVHRVSNKFTQTAQPNFMEFADATSSDWSLFTSSDEASFTSESTRDSFSTTDYSDTCRVDPFSSMLKTRALDRPSQRTISCRMFSGSKPVTRYVTEQTGYILDSYNSIDEIYTGGDTRQVSVPFNEAYLSDSGYQNFVNYETSSSDDFIGTFSNIQL